MLDVVPDDEMDVYFFPAWAVEFFLDDDADPTLGNLASFSVPPGYYDVFQGSVAGFFTQAECVDPTGDSSAFGRQAFYVIASGETVRCTFRNTRQGTITIVQDVIPDLRESFSYSSNFEAPPWHADYPDDPGPGSETVYVLAGTYQITQGARDDIPLVQITCDDASGGTTSDLASRTATIDLQGYENVTCTFQNVLPTGFFTVAPCRVVDTRRQFDGPAIEHEETRQVHDFYSCGIPESTAVAVVANITVTDATGRGRLTTYPPLTSRPSTSVIEFGPGQTRANNAVLGFNRDCCGSLFVVPTLDDSGTVHVVIDVLGYFQ